MNAKGIVVHGIHIYNTPEFLPGEYIVATRVDGNWYYYGAYDTMTEAIDASFGAHPSYPRMVFYVGA